MGQWAKKAEQTPTATPAHCGPTDADEAALSVNRIFCTSFGKNATATSNAASFVTPFCSLMHPIMSAQYLVCVSFGYAGWIWA